MDGSTKAEVAFKAGSADPLTWWGAALYLNGNVSDKFGLGVRAERFDNSEGGIYLLDGDGAGTAVTSPLSETTSNNGSPNSVATADVPRPSSLSFNKRFRTS